ncbi:hypothetical protein CsSME_00006108 [Camellia sinensis var. sinensis]
MLLHTASWVWSSACWNAYEECQLIETLHSGTYSMAFSTLAWDVKMF